MITSEPRKCQRYTLSIGMNDKDSNCQICDTQRIIHLIHSCCKGYGCAYSASLADSGYHNSSGQYVHEPSIVVTLIDPEEEAVKELARDLCAFLHQETVLVCVDEVSCCYISEQI